MRVVYEYVLDTNNDIVSIQEWPWKRRPELAGNPPPIEGMLKIGGLRDQFDRPKWKFVDNDFVQNAYGSPGAKRKAKRKWKRAQLANIAKRLIKGIQDPTDPDYLEVVELLDSLDEADEPLTPTGPNVDPIGLETEGGRDVKEIT